jgi:hypothetical protein
VVEAVSSGGTWADAEVRVRHWEWFPPATSDRERGCCRTLGTVCASAGVCCLSLQVRWHRVLQCATRHVHCVSAVQASLLWDILIPFASGLALYHNHHGGVAMLYVRSPVRTGLPTWQVAPPVTVRSHRFSRTVRPCVQHSVQVGFAVLHNTMLQVPSTQPGGQAPSERHCCAYVRAAMMQLA